MAIQVFLVTWYLREFRSQGTYLGIVEPFKHLLHAPSMNTLAWAAHEYLLRTVWYNASLMPVLCNWGLSTLIFTWHNGYLEMFLVFPSNQVFDESALSQRCKEEMYKCYPDAKRAHLKSGGNFPYLSRSSEVNLMLQVSPSSSLVSACYDNVPSV